MKQLNLIRMFLIILLGTGMFNTMEAQRVFVPSEKGQIEEVKEGYATGNFKPISFPSKLVNTLTDPVKLYIYSNYTFDSKEFSIALTYTVIGANDDIHYYETGPRLKKCFQLDQISKYIYCLTIDTKSLPARPGKIVAKCLIESEIGIKYKPCLVLKKVDCLEDQT